MKVEYKNSKLRKKLLNPIDREKAFGETARRIDQRLSEFNAASSLEEIRRFFPKANCHELTGEWKGKFAVNVSRNFRIIFEPATDPLPRKLDGGIDWVEIKSIKILSVEDYH